MATKTKKKTEEWGVEYFKRHKTDDPTREGSGSRLPFLNPA